MEIEEININTLNQAVIDNIYFDDFVSPEITDEIIVKNKQTFACNNDYAPKIAWAINLEECVDCKQYNRCFQEYWG